MAEKEIKKERKLTIKIPKINLWMFSTLALAMILLVSLTGWPISLGFFGIALTKEQAGKKAVDYINNNLVQPGTKVTLVSVEETNGVYKIITLYQGREVSVYMTKDGNYLFLQAFDTSQELQKSQQKQAKSCEDLKKADKPLLQAFVVSYCPFGLQMQRILAEIAPILGDIEVRYIGSVVDNKVTAMHGDTEAQENLRQICIREEQSNKYWQYVSCFMKKEDGSENCLTEANIDRTKLDSCMKNPDKGVKYAKEDFDLADSYEVTGSPTLILNGEHVSEFDFGGRTAEAVKTLLCCGFNQKPATCSQQLKTTQAATGFSETYSSSSETSGGTC